MCGKDVPPLISPPHTEFGFPGQGILHSSLSMRRFPGTSFAQAHQSLFTAENLNPFQLHQLMQGYGSLCDILVPSLSSIFLSMQSPDCHWVWFGATLPPWLAKARLVAKSLTKVYFLSNILEQLVPWSSPWTWTPSNTSLYKPEHFIELTKAEENTVRNLRIW